MPLVMLMLALGSCHVVFPYSASRTEAREAAVSEARPIDARPDAHPDAHPDVIREGWLEGLMACAVPPLYDDDFQKKLGWLYPEPDVQEVAGVATYASPDRGGSVYKVNNPLYVPAGCRLSITVNRKFTSGEISIRLSDEACHDFDSCDNKDFKRCSLLNGDGPATCDIDAQPSAITYKTIRLYRSHWLGSTAIAAHLTIQMK